MKLSLKHVLTNKIGHLLTTKDSSKENLPVSFCITDTEKIKVYFSKHPAPVFYKRAEDFVDFVEVLTKKQVAVA